MGAIGSGTKTKTRPRDTLNGKWDEGLLLFEMYETVGALLPALFKVGGTVEAPRTNEGLGVLMH